MAYSDELRAEKRSYERDLGKLCEAKGYLESACYELKDDQVNSLVEMMKKYLVIDDEYYEKEPLRINYESIGSAIGTVEWYISKVEGAIQHLEREIEYAEAEEAADDD